eukprot:TRINITY_DN5019_c0_g1_i1.p1 TRINITY_DN5019_c0_g1~~TRINITY_DN5019_c0_g1_i1.p1  ORF type:complete len:296 (+),score=67.89 TRINITY_DN5019_c0_g1_i1:109-888(+)
MAQVAEYFHRFASYEQKETSARRVAKFLKFLRDMQTRQEEYERRVRKLLEWIAEQETKFSDHKFGSTLGEAQAASAALRKFVVEERPAQEGEKMDLESLLAEIQTELKVNGRASYVPPSGLTPEDVQAALDALTKSQNLYAGAVRENRFKFVQKAETKLSDDKLKEIEDSFNHFDSNKNGTLDKLEFKAALSAMSVFFPSDKEFDEVLARVSEGSSKVSKEQYLNYVQAKYQRSEERFSRNAETDLVCRLLLEKKKRKR